MVTRGHTFLSSCLETGSQPSPTRLIAGLEPLELTPLFAVAERVLGDERALELVAPLTDLEHLRFLEIAPDRALGRQPVGAVNLDSILGDFHAHVGREQFGHAGLVAGAGHARVLELPDAPAEQAGGLDAGQHVRQQRLDHLESAQLLAELATLASVAERSVHARLRLSNRS